MKKIECKNDWGRQTFYLGKTKLSRTTHPQLRLRFPDGTEGLYPIDWHAKTLSVSDWGHFTTVTSTVPYVKLFVKGIPVTVEVNGLEAEEETEEERKERLTVKKEQEERLRELGQQQELERLKSQIHELEKKLQRLE